jgi:hypothetical protein
MTTKNTLFVNLTNHPSAQWGVAQTEAVKALGFDVIVDCPAGITSPTASGLEVSRQAQDLLSEARALAEKVMGREHADISNVGYAIGGEMSMTVALAYQITNHLYCNAYVATTDRKSVEKVAADGTVTKTSIFEFVQWRPLYI